MREYAPEHKTKFHNYYFSKLVVQAMELMKHKPIEWGHM